MQRDITISASSVDLAVPAVGGYGDDQAAEVDNVFMDADETILASDRSQGPCGQSTHSKNGVSEL